MLRHFFIIFLTLSISACGVTDSVKDLMGREKDNSEPPSPLVEFTSTATINEAWKDSLGKGSDELFIKLVPVLLNDNVFVADTDGDVAAINANSGKRVWKQDLDIPVTGGPGADNNLVLLGTSEGDVVSLSPETGQEVWRAKVSSEILSSPREEDNVVVVRTIDGKIFALNGTSGERLWLYDRTVPALTLRGTSTPVIAKGVVIAGFDGGRVTALDLYTGKLLWERRVAISSGRSELERMVDVDAQPLIMDDVIYITSFQSNITALSLESGQIIWQREISSHSELAADTTRLYITDDNSHVWALDRFSGSSIWKQEKLQARNVTGPAVIGNKIVVGDLEGYLHWLDRDTGYFTARNRLSDAPIITSAIANDDKLFIYSSDGKLAAYSYTDNGIPVADTVVEVKEESKSSKDDAKSEEEDEGFSFKDIFSVFGSDDEEDK